MHWVFARADERKACRIISRCGGSCKHGGRIPFVSHVRLLWVRGTAVTDGDIASLGPLLELSAAELGYSGVTDRGAASLLNYPSLKYVFLWGTKITDETVSVLAKMSGLRLVNLSDTGVTQGGFDELKQALPNCLVSHSEFGAFFRGIAGPDARHAWVKSGEQCDQSKRPIGQIDDV
jgi:hypothetical protein